MKQSIIEIIERGGTISIPYKTKINEWYGELKITKLDKNEYVIQPYWQKFSDVEDAVNWFLNEGFTSKNKGYIQGRLDDKGVKFSDYDIENPTKEVKDAFKKEGKIVDNEAKSFNITIKPFPKVEEAIEYFDKMIKDVTIDNLVDLLSEFEKKYMPLDPYISLKYVFTYTRDGELNEFSSGMNYDDFNKEDYNRIINDKSMLKSFDNFKYSNIRLTIKIDKKGKGDYINYNLDF